MLEKVSNVMSRKFNTDSQKVNDFFLSESQQD